jgi:GDP-L-fucose synthase
VNDLDLIYVAGSETLIGRALVQRLEAAGYTNVIATTSEEPDLTNGVRVDAYFAEVRPAYGTWLSFKEISISMFG